MEGVQTQNNCTDKDSAMDNIANDHFQRFEKAALTRMNEMRQQWPDVFTQMSGSQFEDEYDKMLLYILKHGQASIQDTANATAEYHAQSGSMDAQQAVSHLQAFIGEQHQESNKQNQQNMDELKAQMQEFRAEQNGKISKRLKREFRELFLNWQQDHEDTVKELDDENDKLRRSLKESKKQLKNAVKDPLKVLGKLDTLRLTLQKEDPEWDFENVDWNHS